MLSVVVPFYNERESVEELHRLLVSVLEDIGQPFEIIFVDDGSTDGTFQEISKLSPVRGFRLARNAGQTTAFACGIAHATGDIIITLDGDLENRPEDIPRLLAELEKGYDVVAGWRKDRWAGEFVTRKLPSVAANWLISRITGVPLNDHGCCLRVYRREVFEHVTFTGEMHRMLAAYLGMYGAKVTQIPVEHIPRKFGKSKYGFSRTFRVLLDIIAFHFFRKYSRRPMHFFGFSGLISIAAGFAAFVWALYLRIFEGTHFTHTPLPLVVAICVVIGFQFILMGLLAEIFVRSRPSGTSGQHMYEIREKVENLQQ